MTSYTWLIEPQYGAMDWFIGELLPVKRTTRDKWGVIDRQNTLHYPYEISQYKTNVRDYLQVCKNSVWTFMDMQGQLDRSMQEGFAPVNIGKNGATLTPMAQW